MKISDVPSDLIEEILCRVPATPLERLQFTCKRWNALVKDPRFIKKHLDKAPRQPLIVTCIMGELFSTSINLHGIDPFIEFTRKLILKVYIYRPVHCDGLFLFITNGEKPLVVSNPCTGQTLWLKPTERIRSDIFALGYANKKLCNNYKILRFTNKVLMSCRRVEIFEFSSNSWRVSYCDLIDFPPESIDIQKSGVSLKGDTYWLATKSYVNGGNTDYLLVKFDFSTEGFRCLSSPFRPTNCAYYNMSLEVVREEQLSAMYWSLYEQDMEIWVSRKIETTDVSWSNFLKVDLHSIPYLNDRYGFYHCNPSFFMDYDKKVVVCSYNGLKYVYVIGEQEGKFRQVSFGEERKDLLSSLVTSSYVPSLARF